MTLDQSNQTAGAADGDALMATILTAVERQLTKYFTAAAQQTETAKTAAAALNAELRNDFAELRNDLAGLHTDVSGLRTDFADLGPKVDEALDAQRQQQDAAFEAYQIALQNALEERLAEFANHQHWRMNDLEDKVAVLETQPVGIDPEQLIELRQTVRDDVESAMRPSNARIEELTNVTKRFDEQASALVQHVNDTTAALAQRMDEGDQRLTHAVEERLSATQLGVAETVAELETKISETQQLLLQKLDTAETRATDKLLALEARINEEQGQKIANLEAAIGRVGAGFDDAMIAVSQRVLDAENNLAEVTERIDALAETVSHIDQDALDELKSQLSNAVGEAMLVRIELDRVVANTDTKLDKQAVRLGEIEALLTDEMDVGAAVQLERLDELERAMIALDPAQFVRKDELAGAGAGGSAGTAGGGDTTGEVARVQMPSMTLNPRLPGADTGVQNGSHIEADSSFSAH